jgi:four helix bundle protein
LEGFAEYVTDQLVFQKSMDLVSLVCQVCQKRTLAKGWGLHDQMQRAAVSVSANIAEGYERGSRKEYAQFLMIAKGSAGELRCLLRIAERLQFIDSSSADKLIADITEVSRMLRGLANAVRKSIS